MTDLKTIRKLIRMITRSQENERERRLYHEKRAMKVCTHKGCYKKANGCFCEYHRLYHLSLN